jgi:hypothetical protein
MNSLFNELCQLLTAYLSVVRRPLSVAQIVQIVEIVQVAKIHRLSFLLYQILSPFPLVSPDQQFTCSLRSEPFQIHNLQLAIRNHIAWNSHTPI